MVWLLRYDLVNTIGDKDMGKNQHVVKKNDGWGVKGEGNTRDTSHHATQQEAIERAREIAINQHSEVFIHGRNNRFRDRDSYGADSCPPKDKKH
jgi:uncharacterized protein YdaT